MHPDADHGAQLSKGGHACPQLARLQPLRRNFLQLMDQKRRQPRVCSSFWRPKRLYGMQGVRSSSLLGSIPKGPSLWLGFLVFGARSWP